MNRKNGRDKDKMKWKTFRNLVYMPWKIAYHQILVSLSVVVTTKIKPQQEKLREGSIHTGPQIQAIIHEGIEIREGSATHLHGIHSIQGDWGKCSHWTHFLLLIQFKI